MNAQTVDEILTVFAAKFGTTAAHLWGVLIRQAYIDGALAVFWCVASVIVVYNAMIRVPRSLRELTKAKYDEEPPFVFAAVVWSILGLAFLLVGLAHVDTAATALTNPEYHALASVFRALGADQ